MAKYRGKNIEVDDSIFRHKIKKLARKLKVDEKEFIKDQTRLLAKDLAIMTPPFAGGKLPRFNRKTIATKADQRQGEGSILKDMLLNFRITDQSYIDHIYDVTGQKNNIRKVLRNRKGQQYVVDVDRLNFGSVKEAIDWHESRRRESDGRSINRGKAGGNDPNIGRWKSRDVMWISKEVFEKAYNIQKQKVGISKAAFSQAYIKLGGVKVQPWIKRHFSKVKGSGRIGKSIRGPFGLVHGKAPGIGHTQRLTPMILKNRLMKARSHLLKIAKHTPRKSGFR